MSHVLRFEFSSRPDRDAVEADLAVAIFAAECVHGRPGVRMEARYLVSEDGRSCALEVLGAAGETAARIFTGLAAARFGEDGFRVSRPPRDAAPPPVSRIGALDDSTPAWTGRAER